MGNCCCISKKQEDDSDTETYPNSGTPVGNSLSQSAEDRPRDTEEKGSYSKRDDDEQVFGTPVDDTTDNGEGNSIQANGTILRMQTKTDTVLVTDRKSTKVAPVNTTVKASIHETADVIGSKIDCQYSVTKVEDEAKQSLAISPVLKKDTAKSCDLGLTSTPPGADIVIQSRIGVKTDSNKEINAVNIELRFDKRSTSLQISDTLEHKTEILDLNSDKHEEILRNTKHAGSDVYLKNTKDISKPYQQRNASDLALCSSAKTEKTGGTESFDLIRATSDIGHECRDEYGRYVDPEMGRPMEADTDGIKETGNHTVSDSIGVTKETGIKEISRPIRRKSIRKFIKDFCDLVVSREEPLNEQTTECIEEQNNNKDLVDDEIRLKEQEEHDDCVENKINEETVGKNNAAEVLEEVGGADTSGHTEEEGDTTPDKQVTTEDAHEDSNDTAQPLEAEFQSERLGFTPKKKKLLKGGEVPGPSDFYIRQRHRHLRHLQLKGIKPKPREIHRCKKEINEVTLKRTELTEDDQSGSILEIKRAREEKKAKVIITSGGKKLKSIHKPTVIIKKRSEAESGLVPLTVPPRTARTNDLNNISGLRDELRSLTLPTSHDLAAIDRALTKREPKRTGTSGPEGTGVSLHIKNGGSIGPQGVLKSIASDKRRFSFAKTPMSSIKHDHGSSTTIDNTLHSSEDDVRKNDVMTNPPIRGSDKSRAQICNHGTSSVTDNSLPVVDVNLRPILNQRSKWNVAQDFVRELDALTSRVRCKPLTPSQIPHPPLSTDGNQLKQINVLPDIRSSDNDMVTGRSQDVTESRTTREPRVPDVECVFGRNQARCSKYSNDNPYSNCVRNDMHSQLPPLQQGPSVDRIHELTLPSLKSKDIKVCNGISGGSDNVNRNFREAVNINRQLPLTRYSNKPGPRDQYNTDCDESSGDETS